MGKTLLLADDSVTIQKVVGISFASEDIAIVTVDNGDDAIAKARELRPDVILADVVMPGKSGYEVCQAIKADPTTSHVPVLLLTGTFEAFDEEHAAAVGAAGHVSKPFEAQTLVDQVRELLANPPAPPAPAQAPVSRDATTSPDQSFDFFDDAGDDFNLVSGASSAGTYRTSRSDALDPAADNLDIGGNGDAFAFGDDDLGEPMGDLPGDPVAPQDATVAIMPESMPDPAATIVDQSFMSHDDPGHDPVGFAFGDDELPVTPLSGGDPGLSDSLAISSSDLLSPQAPDSMGSRDATPFRGGIGSEVDSLLSGDALDAGPPLPDVEGDPLDDDLGFATPIDDDPLESTASAGNRMPEMPAPPPMQPPADDPFSPEPYSAEPFAEALSDEATSEAFPSAADFQPAPPIPAPPQPQPQPVAAQDATTFMPVEPEPLATRPAPPAEVPVVATPAPVRERPVPVETAPEPTPAPLESEAPPMAEPEPRMAPEAPMASEPQNLSAEVVNRLVEDVTPALREELHQTLERIAWESFGSVTEQLVAQAVERIETIAWDVVPKLAETIIQEEIRKLKERS